MPSPKLSEICRLTRFTLNTVVLYRFLATADRASVIVFDLRGGRPHSWSQHVNEGVEPIGKPSQSALAFDWIVERANIELVSHRRTTLALCQLAVGPRSSLKLSQSLTTR